MTTLVTIDGAVFAADAAKVSVFDRGFLFGDSVFETIRTYKGRPYMLGAHLERLARSASRVFIELPVGIEQIAREVEDAVRMAANPESYIRVIVTRGSGPLGLDSGFEASPTRVVIVASLVLPPEDAYRSGISVVTFRTQRIAEATEAVGSKVGNYLVAVLALRRAREVGASEALIVDAAGNVVEGATSNVFALIDGRLVTPPEDAGILAGITRATVLALALELGFQVELRALSPGDLERASELFITSSIREVLPVVGVDGRAVGQGVPGEVTSRLHAAFREKVLKSAG